MDVLTYRNKQNNDIATHFELCVADKVKYALTLPLLYSFCPMLLSTEILKSTSTGFVILLNENCKLEWHSFYLETPSCKFRVFSVIFNHVLFNHNKTISQTNWKSATAFIYTAEPIIYAIEHWILCTARTAEVCHILVIHLHIFLFYLRYSPLGHSLSWVVHTDISLVINCAACVIRLRNCTHACN